MYIAKASGPKERSTDRILVLKPIDGKAPTSTTGLVDSRLFKGGNNLHAIMNPSTTLWSFKYESGMLPEPLKQQFTSFSSLMKFAGRYFGQRNLQIVEVKD